jgi:hypothetical protein
MCEALGSIPVLGKKNLIGVHVFLVQEDAFTNGNSYPAFRQVTEKAESFFGCFLLLNCLQFKITLCWTGGIAQVVKHLQHVPRPWVQSQDCKFIIIIITATAVIIVIITIITIIITIIIAILMPSWQILGCHILTP